MLKIDKLPKGVTIKKLEVVFKQDNPVTPSAETLEVRSEDGKLQLGSETWGLQQDDIPDFAQLLLQLANATE